MLKVIKSYWAFTNNLYKWVMLVVVPVLLVALNSVLFNVWVAGESGDFLLVSLFVLFFIDAVSDVFFMGGFYRKNNGALEFLQSAPRFEGFMRDVVMVDMVRRILTYQLPFVTSLICALENEGRLEWCSRHSFLPLLETFIAMLVVLVARHFAIINQVYICAMIGYTVILFSLLFLIMACAEAPFVVNGILVMCILLAGVGTVWYTCKKVRESYYDS